MKTVHYLFYLLIPLFGYTQSEPSENTYRFINTYAFNDSIKTVYAAYKTSTFTLKICDSDTCYVDNQELGYTITAEQLAAIVKRFTKNNFEDVTSESLKAEEEDQLKELAYQINLNHLDADNKELRELTGLIDMGKEHYSAQIVLKSKVPFRLKNGIHRTDTATVAEKNKFENLYGNDYIFHIKEARLQFFNNKANTVYIKGYLMNSTDNSVKDLIVVNNNFSVPLRYFNNYGSIIHIPVDSKTYIELDYNDIFDYEADQYFNYSIANSEVSLIIAAHETTARQKIAQRRFFDFFTAILYSDVLGLDGKNSNSALNAKAKLLVPMNLRNWRKFTLTRQFTTEVNFALSNSFDNESRYITLTDNGTALPTFSNFELFTKNNMYGKLSLDVLTYESKGWFLNTSLGYDVGFLRTGLQLTEVNQQAEDTVSDMQLFSIIHGPYLNFEIRPQTNFGADITFALNGLNYHSDPTIGEYDAETIMNYKGHTVYNMVNFEANFYWLTNPSSISSKGGIYAKIGSYYHLEDKTLFPQLMVGYATNLTSFVNKAKNNRKAAITNE